MMSQASIKRVSVSDLVLDYDVYPRQRVMEANVKHLDIELERCGRLDPMVTAEIKGRQGYFLVDGAHRREVYLRKGIKNVEVENLGMLSKKEILKEAWERNTHVPMALFVTDRRLAAQKMARIGMSEDEIHGLTGFSLAFIQAASQITYNDTMGHLAHIPQSLTVKDRESGMIHLKDGITHSEVQEHADVVEKIPRNFAPKAALRHLNTLLEYDWLQIVKDPQARRLAIELYGRLGTVLENE